MAYAEFAFRSVVHVTKALVHSLKCDLRKWELKEVSLLCHPCFPEQL